MLGGQLLGRLLPVRAAGRLDAGAMLTSAVRDGEAYVINGEKAWITHGRSRTSIC